MIYDMNLSFIHVETGINYVLYGQKGWKSWKTIL